MTAHPVQLHVTTPERTQRIHVLIRLVLLIAIGTLGWSSLYWMLYLALPALVALRLATLGGRFLVEDGPRLSRALNWLAQAYAYLWMLTDTFPTGDADAPAELVVETGGTPTMRSALLRLVYSIPAVLLLAILSFAASVLWVIAALFVLVSGRLPAAIADFMALTLRYQFRFLAYHLSLVDRYPSLESPPATHQAPHAGAI